MCKIFIYIFILLAIFTSQGMAADLSSEYNAKPEVSAETMIGQMLMFGFRGTGESDTPEFMEMLEMIRTGKVGGVIFFDLDASTLRRGRNITSPDQLKYLSARLQAAAPIPLFIAVDQEGGKVQRLSRRYGFGDHPSPEIMGKMNNTQLRESALRMGQELKAAGINVNFAPGVDLNINPANPAIGALGRSFGPQSELVTEKAGIFEATLAELGLITSFKHFPGHGSSSKDTHLELTDITNSWQEQELEPYRRLLREDGRHMVMIGHLVHRKFDPLYPASLSKSTINGLLRGELGWQGVVITDDLQMRAISSHYSLKEVLLLAIDAGVDILLMGNNLDYDPNLPVKAYDTMLELYSEGKISRARLEESWRRIMRLKAGIQ